MVEYAALRLEEKEYAGQVINRKQIMTTRIFLNF
jgi:hypothetical protein